MDLRSGSHARLDAAYWLGGSVLLLSLVPIGFLSGDALAHSAAFTRGDWFWNPNHLLIEPISAWWHQATLMLGIDRPGVDRLKLLSALSAAVAAGLFRLGPASLLTSTRLAANHATAWLVGMSAFLRLAVSGETHMLQMPALVVVAWFTGRLLLDPQRRTAWLVGLAIGASALFYISNILLGVTLPLVAYLSAGRRQQRPRIRHLWPVPAGAALTAGAGLLVAWLVLRPDRDPLPWILSYGGGRVPASVAESYGTTFSLNGVLGSVARTLYGTVCALVDVSPLVGLWRGEIEPSLLHVLLGFAALAAGVFLIRQIVHGLRESSAGPTAVRLGTGFAAAVVVFGLYWNNSDDQFYFQLSVATGVLAAAAPPRRWRSPLLAIGLSAVVLTWNAFDTTSRFVLYPREERIESLQTALDGADLVVIPGQDEVDHLLYFVDSAAVRERLSLTALMARYPVEEGLRTLASRVDDVVSRGGRVDIVGVYDAHLPSQPWRSLAAAGYSAPRVRSIADAYDTAVREVGPFTIVSVTADHTGG